MTKTFDTTKELAITGFNDPLSLDQFSRPQRQPQRGQSQMRRYEVVYLLPNGDIDDFSRVAPSHPAFEDSFGAIARGGLLKTCHGIMAIEDILPGDQVMTTINGFQTVKWRGAMTIAPNNVDRAPETRKLIRVAADALSVGRPMSDLLLGPSAHLYHNSPNLQRIGQTAAFVPAADFIDGVNIVEINPPTPMQVFQLGFDTHERIAVNDVEIDSHTPGARHQFRLRGDMLDLYLSLFPHVKRIEDFGMQMHPRMSLNDLNFDVIA